MRDRKEKQWPDGGYMKISSKRQKIKCNIEAIAKWIRENKSTAKSEDIIDVSESAHKAQVDVIWACETLFSNERKN